MEEDRQRQHFKSVREAISNYGEVVASKARKPNVVEKLAAVDEELKSAKNEIDKLNIEMSSSEARRLQAVEEANEMKKVANDLKSKLEAAMHTIQVCDNAKIITLQQSEIIKQELEDLEAEAELQREENSKLKSQLAEIRELVTNLTGSANVADGVAKLQQLAFDTMQDLASANDLLNSDDLLNRGLTLESNRSAKQNACKSLEIAKTEYQSLADELTKLKLENLTLKDELIEAERSSAGLDEIRRENSNLIETHAKEVSQLASEIDAIKQAQEQGSGSEQGSKNTNAEIEGLRAALLIEKEKARVESEQFKSSMENNALKLSSIEQLFFDFKRSLDEKESSAHRKISAALNEASAARIREQHMLIRIDALREELDEAKAAAGKALRRAEAAEAEKLIIESEAKRWRKASKILSDRSISKKQQHHRRSPTIDEIDDDDDSTRSEHSNRSILGSYLSRKKESR